MWIMNYAIVYTHMFSDCTDYGEWRRHKQLMNDIISLVKGTSEFAKRQKIVLNIHDDSTKVSE